MIRVGVDVGGTFTDFFSINDHGSFDVLKYPSSVPNVSAAVLEGLRELANRDPNLVVCHGTTVATNALIEGRGSRTALITTRGFRDIVEIGRLSRPPGAIYDLQYEKPRPLVPRALRFEVAERLNDQGNVEVPLAEEEILNLIPDLVREAAEVVVVSFLFSFLNPVHETLAKRILLANLPKIRVLTSSEILPVIREYERTSTALISAYVLSAVDGYLGTIRDRLAVERESKFFIMQSNGGLSSAEIVLRNPGSLILSGPAGGVIGACFIGKASGFHNMISADMGGTSFDVSMISAGTPILSSEREVLGHPLHLSMIDIHTIGAGGGSIARLDSAQGLRVGPEGAGAHPGPACYGLGGTVATVTDASLCMGYLDPAYFLGGRMPLYPALAEGAIRQNIANPLGMTVPEAAEGIHRIVVTNMAGAIRLVSLEKGYDPREFVLFAFGGAGPIHAAELIRELEIPWTVVPPYPGITSALGIALADVQHEHVQSLLVQLSEISSEQLEQSYERLIARGDADLAKEGVPSNRRAFVCSVDMRYAGQVYTLNIPVRLEPDRENPLTSLAADFHERHETIFGFRVAANPIEIVNARILAVGMASTSITFGVPDGKAERVASPRDERQAFFRGTGWRRACLYDRSELVTGHILEGPAIVTQEDTTTVIPPDMTGVVDAFGNLVIGPERWKQ